MRSFLVVTTKPLEIRMCVVGVPLHIDYCNGKNIVAIKLGITMNDVFITNYIIHASKERLLTRDLKKVWKVYSYRGYSMIPHKSISRMRMLKG